MLTPTPASNTAVKNFRLPILRSALKAGNAMFLLLLTACMVAVSGCGAGGYPGGGITSLSSSKITIDAGQSFAVSATATSGLTVSWSLAGASCSGSGCGTVSSTTGASITYAAPAALTAPIQVTLTAQIGGTSNSKVVSITVNPAPVISGSTPSGTVATPYSATLTVTGGTTPLKQWSLASGTLPAGLTLNPTTGVISGTPTTVGSSTFSVQITDSSDVPDTVTATRTIQITLNGGGGGLTFTIAPPTATIGTPYTGVVTPTGGTGPYTCVITNLPAGLTANGCTISGTPTGPAGLTNVNVTGTDSSPTPITTTGTAPLTILTGSGGGGLTFTIAPPTATIGTPYTGTVGVSGGIGPYTCVVTNLPPGLTASGCTISGTPTGPAGLTNVNVTGTDSSPTPITTSGTAPLTINTGSGGGGTLTFTVAPNTGTIGTPYTGMVNVAGGTAPYACTLTGLPAGLTATGCAITGTPAGPAGLTNIHVSATDSSSTPIITTGTAPLTINTGSGGGVVLTLGAPANGTVGVTYSSAVTVGNGTAPYACVISGLPAGLTSNSCAITGVPQTQGTSILTVTATDSGSPQVATTGTLQLVIAPATVTIVLGSLPNGTVNVAYSQTLGVTGGTGPYSCTITGLPAGLSSAANSCLITGTPTTSGTSSLTVTATDSSSPKATHTGPVSLTISPAVGSLILSAPPNGTINVPYTGSVGVTGGAAPYSCTITGLPAGLSSAPNSCAITGTPTNAGSTTIHVTATDGTTPTALTTTGNLPLVINPAAATLTLVGPSATGTVNTPYSSSVQVSGGVSPYTCSITNLPAGLTASNCSITGTPTAAGSSTINVTATDATTPTALTKAGTFPIVISNAAALTISSPAAGNVGTPYTGAVGVGGGTGPYSCVITGLPAGLTSNSCAITGTPTVAGTSTLSVTATDSSTPTPVVTTGPATLVINAPLTLSLTGTLPNAILGQPYTQTLQATGGISPYSYAVTTGSLPAGLSLATDGTITGTPTAVGASSFTVTVTDTEAPVQTATNNYVLLVTYPTGPNNGELVGPYAFLFQGYDDLLVGLINYQTASVGSFTADGLGVLTTGELDTNHQVGGSSTHGILGSYEIGADNRGLMAITALNADGTTGLTTIFSLSVKAPVSPATVATQAQIIEYDGDIIVSSRGSGQILQQTATSFTTGLSGAYAFGLSGDTGCGLSCSVGLSGPVASVGTFTASANALSNGESDANIGTTNYPSEGLSGSYGTADSNGRLTLNMTTTGTPAGFYPTGYVAYMVNANQSFVMSNDTHASYALLAGTAQAKTLPSFDSTSFSGPIIGYENSQANPGLLGVVLKDVLNVSTATVFRTVASPGSCTTSNVDSGGVNTVLGDVTGTVGALLGSTVVNALLGTYQSLGTSSCTIAGNGRGSFAYPPPSSLLAAVLGLLGLDNPPAPRTFYLTGPGKGYFLETGYAALGNLEPQTGGPYTLANFNGTFVYGGLPPATAVGINSNGFLTADGAGNITSTLATNVSVGTLNLLTPTVTGSGTYTYSPNLAPLDFTNPATVGRYVYGSNAIYEISPGRFVLVDTNPLTTSPTVTLLY